MKYGCVGVVCALGLISATDQTFAQSAGDKVAALGPASRAPVYMRIYGNAQPPYGFVRFCEGHPEDCAATPADDSRYSATPERLSELDEVNRAINAQIEPATDSEIYGITELWTIPTFKGDCEDFALLKRRTLMGRGWPAGALILTVVRDEKNEGHAVLTARTSQGDFILDNKNEQVRLWNHTPYHFVMRQSYINPKVWVSLDPSDITTPAALAGVQANP